MSCEDPIITPSGRRGIGVNQPQSGLDYPLIAPSDDIRYLIADFYLAYEDPGFYSGGDLYQHPLKIKWLYGIGCEPSSKPVWAPNPVNAADILVVDANGSTVFDSTQLVPEGGDTEYRRFVQRSWGDDYEIYEWIGNQDVCRLVVYKTWPGEAATTFDIEPRDWPTHIAPVNAVLDERAVYKMPKRLRSIKVVSGAATLGSTLRNGAVFVPGNNMIIENDAPGRVGVRQTTEIMFTAEPGAGIGKYDNCPEEPAQPIYRINGAPPNEYGDFLLGGADCIWVRQPTSPPADGRVTPAASTMRVGSNCPACCDCPDYEETALYMNRTANRYRVIGARTHEIKLLHESNIERWVEQRECRLEKPLTVLMTPQACPYMDVLIMFCNKCQDCAENVRLQVTFSTLPAGATATVECGYTFLTAPGYSGVPYTMEGAWPTFYANLPPVDVSNSAYVRFRLKFSPRFYPYTVLATLTGTKSGSPITAGCEPTDPPASATREESLRCDSAGNTILIC